MFFKRLSLLFILPLMLSTAISAANKTNDLRLNTIVVDAGHGGKDAGTVSADKKTYEKTIALKIAKKFAAKVREAYPEMKVVMTRDKDEFVPLNTRARIATDAGAGLFISIHINAMPRGIKSTNGFTAYILGQSKKYDSYDVNLEVCKQENSVIYLEDNYSTTYKDFDSSPEAQIMLQLMQRAYREQSLKMAEQVSSKMSKGPFAKSVGVMQDNFAVLRLASMPAVLLEFGFMTNPDDLAVLRNEDKVNKMVDNLFKAFAAYKADYDSSVSLGTPEPQKEQSKPEVKPEPKKEEPKPEVKPEPKKEEPKAEVKKEEPKAEAKPDVKDTVDNGQDLGIRPFPKSPSKTEVKSERPEGAGDVMGAEPPSNRNGAVYGTQVLASSKLMTENDPYFKGNKVDAVKVGTIYKYILNSDEDFQKAKQNFNDLKKIYKDCFLVKVENGNVTIAR